MPVGPETARKRLKEPSPDYEYEVRRKGFHLIGLVIPLGYLIFPNTGQAKAVILGAMIFAVAIDAFRLSEPSLRHFLNSLIGAIMRPHEKSDLLGSTCLLVSSTMTVLIFPKGIAASALCLLIGGDTAAALVGKRFGRVRLFGRKTLEGTLAFIGAGLVLDAGVILLLAMTGSSDPASLTWATAAVGAVVGAVVEAVPFPIDDNFAIPIISGVAMVLAGIG
jgi:dolichol kinase